MMFLYPSQKPDINHSFSSKISDIFVLDSEY